MKKEVYEVYSDRPNKNGRTYSLDLLKNKIGEYEKIIESNQALGELDHPETGVVSLANLSHVVKGAFLKKERVPRKKKKQLKKLGDWTPLKRQLMVEVEFLDTPSGKIAKELKDFDFDIGMRAIGSVNEGVIQDDLEIISFDIITK
jgi:hypothetical protein